MAISLVRRFYCTFSHLFSIHICAVTLSVPAATPAVIVLSKLDERYFDDISSPSTWNLDFIVYKKGEKKPYAFTSHSRFFSRSINLETHLDAGDYVIHVRLLHFLLRQRP